MAKSVSICMIYYITQCGAQKGVEKLTTFTSGFSQSQNGNQDAQTQLNITTYTVIYVIIQVKNSKVLHNNYKKAKISYQDRTTHDEIILTRTDVSAGLLTIVK